MNILQSSSKCLLYFDLNMKSVGHYANDPERRNTMAGTLGMTNEMSQSLWTQLRGQKLRPEKPRDVQKTQFVPRHLPLV
jgi:hypothetical protein